MRASPYGELLTQASRCSNAVVAAVADNCRFDERASAKRWQEFESLVARHLADTSAIAWADWEDAYRRHLAERCHVVPPSVPDAFLEINQDAWLTTLLPNQSVVRIEDLNRRLDDSSLELDDLRELLQRADEGDSDGERAAETFFDDWNRDRDARPAFVAFLDDVQEELDDADWPHACRDRLGLGHYGPIALMRYSLADVFNAQKQHRVANACALPTVLDGGMHEFLLPCAARASVRSHCAFGAGPGRHAHCRTGALPDRLRT